MKRKRERRRNPMKQARETERNDSDEVKETKREGTKNTSAQYSQYVDRVDVAIKNLRDRDALSNHAY